jgi:hypothetical protein
MLSSPVGKFVSGLQTSEIPEELMKHGVFLKPRYFFLQILCDLLNRCSDAVRLGEWKTKNLEKCGFCAEPGEGFSPPSNAGNGEMVYKWASKKRNIQQYKYGGIQRD